MSKKSRAKRANMMERLQAESNSKNGTLQEHVPVVIFDAPRDAERQSSLVETQKNREDQVIDKKEPLFQQPTLLDQLVDSIARTRSDDGLNQRIIEDSTITGEDVSIAIQKGMSGWKQRIRKEIEL